MPDYGSAGRGIESSRAARHSRAQKRPSGAENGDPKGGLTFAPFRGGTHFALGARVAGDVAASEGAVRPGPQRNGDAGWGRSGERGRRDASFRPRICRWTGLLTLRRLDSGPCDLTWGISVDILRGGLYSGGLKTVAMRWDIEISEHAEPVPEITDNRL